MLVNVKMPTVGILTFMSVINCILSWVEHENVLYPLDLECCVQCRPHDLTSSDIRVHLSCADPENIKRNRQGSWNFFLVINIFDRGPEDRLKMLLNLRSPIASQGKSPLASNCFSRKVRNALCEIYWTWGIQLLLEGVRPNISKKT